MVAAAPFTEAKARNARLNLKFLGFFFVCRPLSLHYHEQLNQQIFCVVQFEKCIYGGVSLIQKYVHGVD
jgi:hypothetical protein